MHQQVRTSPTRTGSEGPGADWNRGGVVDILTILRDRDFNLQTAGGCDLDGTGEFVFSVRHGGDDDGTNEEAAQLLRDNGYQDARTVNVESCNTADEPGGLLACLQKLEDGGDSVVEIFVGTPEDDGSIPIQIVTRRALEEGRGSAESAA